ncbi:MAG TPA: helix-turn-helix domain-containing protein [Polyangiales bacterium]|nr:helix-turn-helix domain-containing protein [Polyangiales bacterium]
MKLDAPRSTCPIACSLDLVGDRWTLLVLRDLFFGKHRYEEFLGSPEGIATNILSARLKRLEEYGMIDSRICPENRRRKHYELTALGRSFGPVVAALARWGLEHIEGTEEFEAAKRSSRRPPQRRVKDRS